MAGLKTEWLRLMNMTKVIGDEFPEYIAFQQQKIYNILEDVHSVASMTELQDAIDSIGNEAGTIFITAGTHVVDTPIDIDGGSSLVIYGHGNNTILLPNAGIPIFNITDCQSLIIKTLQIDASKYTGATSSVIVNEVNDNVISFEDVTIVGNNLGTGIELVSNNCMIEHCNISQLQDGIYINNSNRHIISQNIIQNNVRYGINLNTALYSNIGNNTCNLNLTGIYVLNSSNNSISNNICNQNTENGIYIHGSSYNTFSGNTCENNDSNTVNSQAGMYITNNSDFNTISGNSLNNNNNIGAGTGYGIIIATATCEENVVASNNYNGNDIDIHDVGVGTEVKYYVQNVDELQDAINSIGSGAGVIQINSSFNVSATIIIDGNGSYLIEGEGDNTVLTTVGDIKCFDVDIARQVVFKNFKIDASSLITATREIIDVNENNNNLIVFDNVSITGDGTNGYGIELNSNNCRIKNCTIDTVNIGLNILSTDNIIEGNNINTNASYGILIGGNYNIISTNICNSNVMGIYVNGVDYNSIFDNTVNSNSQNGIYLTGSDFNNVSNNSIIGNDSNTANAQAGVYISSDSNNNNITGNSILNNNNAGGGVSYGVYIDNVNCIENIVRSNNISGNDAQWLDIGVNSDIGYRCSTGQEIQDALDSIDDKSGIIHILPVVGGIQLSTPILVNGGGNYVIEGEGEGSIIDCAGNRTAFDITDAKAGTTLKNFNIDTNDHTSSLTSAININETNNNKIICENLHIYGDGIHTTGIWNQSDGCEVLSCIFTDITIGVLLQGDYCVAHNNQGYSLASCLIAMGAIGNIASFNIAVNCGQGIIPNESTYYILEGNVIYNAGVYGIRITGSSFGVITNNIIYSAGSDGIYFDADAPDFSTYNICNDNIIKDGAGWGIRIDALCDNNKIGINQIINNATGTITDAGTGTKIFGDDTAYGIAWNGDLGTPTKNAVYDKIFAFQTGYNAHRHDGHTLQLDGISSDGGGFDFITSGLLSFRVSNYNSEYISLFTYNNIPYIAGNGAEDIYFRDGITGNWNTLHADDFTPHSSPLPIESSTEKLLRIKNNEDNTKLDYSTIPIDTLYKDKNNENEGYKMSRMVLHLIKTIQEYEIRIKELESK